MATRVFEWAEDEGHLTPDNVWVKTGETLHQGVLIAVVPCAEYGYDVLLLEDGKIKAVDYRELTLVSEEYGK